MEYLLNIYIMRDMRGSSAVNKKENSSEYLPETGVLKVFHGLSTIHSENIQRVVHRKRLHYRSRLFGFKRKSQMPIVTKPFSSLLSLILSLMTIIFLKESSIFLRERFSCSVFSALLS